MPMFARSAGLTCEAGCEVFSWNANGGCATASVVAASRIPRTSLVDCKLLNAYIHFLARSACWCRPYGTQFDLALYPGLTPGAKKQFRPCGAGFAAGSSSMPPTANSQVEFTHSRPGLRSFTPTGLGSQQRGHSRVPADLAPRSVSSPAKSEYVSPRSRL